MTMQRASCSHGIGSRNRSEPIMHTTLNDWNNGWFGVELSIQADEIDRLISLLQMLKAEPDQHFHLSSRYQGEGGIGDIEISIQPADVPSNMVLLGGAMPPGAEIEVDS